MSTATAKLLLAALEKAGSTKVLADRLGITETVLAGFMADGCPLPDPLLLRVVDVVLAEQTFRYPLVKQPPPLLEEPATPENGSDEAGTAPGEGAAE